MEFLGIVIGAFLAGGIGIFTVYLTKYLEEERTKLYVSKALLVEVEANQERLQKLVKAIEIVGKDKVGHIQIPTSGIYFDKVIYPALADKIGLLDDESMEKLVRYYGKINSMEVQLRIIHEISSSTLEGFSNEQIPLLKEGGRKTFFKFAEEAYNTGEKLIENLKEQIESKKS